MNEDIGHRAATITEFESTSADGPIRAALSSETPVAILGGKEILSHAPEAIDWSGVSERGIPLTIGHSERDPHSQHLPIGRVNNFDVRNGVMRGDLNFDSDDAGVAARGKVVRGVAPDISLTFKKLAPPTRLANGMYEVTRWAPLAASIVTLPADASVGVGRSLDLAHTEAPMSETTTEAAPTPEPGIIEKIESRRAAGYQQGAGDARRELADIHSRALEVQTRRPDLSDDIQALVKAAGDDAEMTSSRFNQLLLDLMVGAPVPSTPAIGAPEAPAFAMPGDSRRPSIQIGADSRETAFRGLELAVLERAVPSAIKPEEMEGNRYRGWSMLDVAREILTLHGTDSRGMSSEQIAKAAIGMRAISPGTANYVTTDFPRVTENIGFKAAFEGFNRAENLWRMFCSTGSTPDFKQFSVPRLSHTSLLPIVAENAAYTDLTRADQKENGQAQKRGGLVSYSWEAVVNNDVNSFADQMMSCGEAAAATIDRDVFDLLTLNQIIGASGPVMNDTNQLFSSPHNNVITTALSLQGIVDARVAMGRQTDDNAQEIAPRLSYVIVPLELEDEARNLAGSEYLVDVGGAAQRANTVRNTFEVVPTQHLTDTTDWFASARIGQFIRVFFLNGVQAPTLERENGWDTDAMHYKVRIVYDVVPQDWRGAVWAEVAGA